MRIPFRFLTAFSFVFAAATFSLRADMAPYLGEWQVDVAATFEAGKQSPKYNAAEDERMKPTITKMLESMSLTISPETFAMSRGGKNAQTLPYTFENTTNGVTTVSVAAGDKTLPFTLSVDAQRRLRLKSSGAPHLDYYVWTPRTTPPRDAPGLVDVVANAVGGTVVSNQANKAAAKPAPTIKDNLRVLLHATHQYNLEMGTPTAPYDALVKGKYFKPLQVVNGEDYSTAVIDSANNSASVTDKDGVTHTYKPE